MALAELHLHLEGSVEPETLCLLDPSLSVDEVTKAYAFVDFAGFIEAFKWVSQRLRSPGDYALVTEALCRRLAAENITYAEITLAAGVVLWKKQDLAAVYASVHATADDSPVEVHWNLDSIRQFGPDLAWQVAEFAAGQVGNGIVSIGIGGDEIAGPPEWFSDVYRFAKTKGLGLTAHAGETAGPASIWGALEIGAERIGHGIRAIDDPVLMRHLAQNHIPLEIGITSNLCTGAVPSLSEHPIRKLYDGGVPVTINTDDPAIFRTTLGREFAIAQEHLGLAENDLNAIQANAWAFRFSKTAKSRASDP